MQHRKTAQAFILVSTMFFGGIVSGNTLAIEALESHDDPYAALYHLSLNLGRIQNEYVTHVKTEQLVHDAIAGMVDNLDEHSHYFPPSEYAKLKERTDQWYVGAGMDLNEEKIITQLFTKGPASIAGLMVGDQLHQINNLSTANMSLSQIQKLFRGQKGDIVSVQILRDLMTQDFEIVLDDVQQLNAECLKIGQNAVYIRIERFGEGVATLVKEQLLHLQQQTEITGIILDLRNNPGGNVTEGVAIADLFLNEGLISRITYRNAVLNQEHKATSQNDDILEARLAILINGDSASAAELVAGALQDHGRGIVIGTPSFGKGSVQKMYSTDEDALKLTVGHFSAGHQNISKNNPIQPNIPISLDLNTPKDLLLQKIQALQISAQSKDGLLQVTSQLPNPPIRTAIPGNLNFEKGSLWIHNWQRHGKKLPKNKPSPTARMGRYSYHFGHFALD